MNIYLLLLTDITDDFLKRDKFTNELNLAEVIPLFRKADPSDKSNCRPISLHSHISEIFQRIVYKQINEYIKPFLSKTLTGFRKKLLRKL